MGGFVFKTITTFLKLSVDATLPFMNKSPITIINDENMRGIVAPSSAISKKMFEDFIDFFELSTSEEVAREDRLIREADKADSWIPFVGVRSRGKRAR